MALKSRRGRFVSVFGAGHVALVDALVVVFAVVAERCHPISSNRGIDRGSGMDDRDIGNNIWAGLASAKSSTVVAVEMAAVALIVIVRTSISKFLLKKKEIGCEKKLSIRKRIKFFWAVV